MCVTCGCSDAGGTKITNMENGNHTHALPDGTVIRACPILLEPILNKGFNRFYSRHMQDYGKYIFKIPALW